MALSPFGGLGAQQPQKKAYNQAGQEVDASTGPVVDWQPNTGYSPGILFNAPPPPREIEPERQQRELSTEVTRANELPFAQGPLGHQAVTLPMYNQQVMLQAQLAQQQKQFESQMSKKTDIDSLMSRYGQPIPRVSGGMGGNEEAARSAAFGRAKDIAAKQALAGLKTARGLTEGSGMMGSTYEAGLLGDAIGGAQGIMSDANTNQLLQDLARSRQVADRDYTGDITQRSQDLARQQAILALVGRLY